MSNGSIVGMPPSIVPTTSRACMILPHGISSVVPKTTTDTATHTAENTKKYIQHIQVGVCLVGGGSAGRETSSTCSCTVRNGTAILYLSESIGDTDHHIVESETVIAIAELRYRSSLQHVRRPSVVHVPFNANAHFDFNVPKVQQKKDQYTVVGFGAPQFPTIEQGCGELFGASRIGMGQVACQENLNFTSGHVVLDVSNLVHNPFCVFVIDQVNEIHQWLSYWTGHLQGCNASNLIFMRRRR